MANVTRYNAKDCVICIEDSVFITGLGEDMVSGEKNEDYFTPITGAQGDTIKSEINDESGQLTISIQPTSPQKGYLLSLAKRAEPFSIWVTNKALKERMGGSQANLLTAPAVNRGAEAEDMEFVFHVFDYVVEETA